MIQNINFPEGTNVHKSHDYSIDFYADDFVFLPNMDLSYETNYGDTFSRQICYKPINIENVTGVNYFLYKTNHASWIPEYNIANMRNFGTQTNGVKKDSPKVVFAGGSEYLEGFNGAYRLSRFWLRYGDNWDRLKGIIPLDAEIYPYGEVQLRIRVLKDGAWLSGEDIIYEIPYFSEPMEYLGGGVYGYTVDIAPRDIHRYFVVVDGERCALNASDREEILYVGDNGNVITEISGTYILDYATSNPNNWSYDATVGGVRSNEINHGENTYMTLTLPVNEINLQYGQRSEENYDFCNIYDGEGNTLISLKGIKTTDTTVSVTSPDKVFKFEYRKDGSGTYDEDAFWIKSISWQNLPPYPNN